MPRRSHSDDEEILDTRRGSVGAANRQHVRAMMEASNERRLLTPEELEERQARKGPQRRHVPMPAEEGHETVARRARRPTAPPIPATECQEDVEVIDERELETTR